MFFLNTQINNHIKDCRFCCSLTTYTHGKYFPLNSCGKSFKREWKHTKTFDQSKPFIFCLHVYLVARDLLKAYVYPLKLLNKIFVYSMYKQSISFLKKVGTENKLCTSRREREFRQMLVKLEKRMMNHRTVGHWGELCKSLIFAVYCQFWKVRKK